MYSFREIMNTKEWIFRGTISLLILRYLLNGPSHGYALQKKISEDVKYNLPAGMIYTLLKSLEKKKFIIESIDSRSKGRVKKTYVITERGRLFLKNHREPLMIAYKILGELIAVTSQM
jgi:DNA-binding PadR family transcriptional regulator